MQEPVRKIKVKRIAGDYYKLNFKCTVAEYLFIRIRKKHSGMHSADTFLRIYSVLQTFTPFGLLYTKYTAIILKLHHIKLLPYQVGYQVVNFSPTRPRPSRRPGNGTFLKTNFRKFVLSEIKYSFHTSRKSIFKTLFL